MTGDQGERAFAWLMGQRAKNPKYAIAIQQEHHVPASTRPTSPEAQAAVSSLMKDLAR